MAFLAAMSTATNFVQCEVVFDIGGLEELRLDGGTLPASQSAWACR